ncbi:hypothetical protein [uncultured Chitinophaga sp.]|uniref:hypothetical protein n=1 Tax=uncultured Chitinophaga sp. TaxID=339340 RepID=UPI002636D6E8|nr:hypothetical protein [uncultured Chitinophaga sp.]
MKFSLSICSVTASVFFALIFAGQDAKAQLKIGGNTTITRGDAILELESNRKGMLLPRVTSLALTVPPLDTAAQGMMVYNLTDNKIHIRTGSSWKALSDADAGGWNLTGNSSVNPALHFLGTTNAQPLILRTNNLEAARVTADRKLGIGTTAPHSMLHVNGSTATNVAVGTGNFTMADSNSVVIMNNTGTVNFALQNPANYKGRTIEIVAYNTGLVNFTGYTVRGQNGANPTVGLAAGYSLRLVSDGAAWVIVGKQRSGLPLYYATTAGSGEGEVLRDYNGYISHGSGVFQTDVQAEALNQIPNETAWFSMMLQTVGGGYFGQFNLNDHDAYFRGNSISNLGTSVWQKMISHPATISFKGERLGADSLNLNMIANRNVVFSTNNTARMRIHNTGNIDMMGPAVTVEGTTKMKGAVFNNITTVYGNYNVADNDYTIYALISANNQAITLPSGAQHIGRVVVVKTRKNGGGTNRTLEINVAGGGTIEGAGSVDLAADTGNDSHMTFQMVAANNWLIIAR